jgi:hypothetical protein
MGFQPQQLGFPIHQGQHVDAKVILQRRLLVEVVEHHPGVGIPLQLDDDAHAVAIALVANVRNALQPPLVDHFGDSFDHAALLVW